MIWLYFSRFVKKITVVVRCFGENPYICIALNPEWETDAMREGCER